jgi:hypothetical protein
MTKPYTVALLEAHDLPMRKRIDAEVRFARELEIVLGGEEYVGQTYAAWLDVAQSNANQVDKSTAMTAARWPVAMNAGIQAAFAKLGDIGEAHFEVRLERHTA